MPIRIVPLIDTASLIPIAVMAQADGLAPASPWFWEGPAGLLLAGAGFAAYWIVKAVMEAKSGGRNSTPVIVQGNQGLEGVTAIFSKLQELLDAQRASQEALIQALREVSITIRTLQTALLEHDLYVKTHVTERGREIVHTLGAELAPLIVGSIRAAFEVQDVRKVTAREVDSADRKPAKRRKTRA